MTFLARFLVTFFFCLSPLVLCHAALGADVFRYAGATTLQKDFMREASQRFGAVNDVSISIEGGDSSAGIKSLSAGEIEIAGSGRFLTAKEKAAGLVEHLLGWDPLVVVVHLTNPVEDVRTEELRQMLRGTTRNWNEVGGRDLPILQVVAPGGSGVHEAVDRLLLSGEHVSSKAIVSLIVADADRNVGNLPAAFTVTSMSMVDSDRVKIIKVDGELPSHQTISSGKYPMIKPLLLVTKGQPKGKLALFINFAKSPEGQGIIAKKFFPLQIR